MILPEDEKRKKTREHRAEHAQADRDDLLCTVISVYLLLSFEPWAQQCEQAEDDEHGRDHEGVRFEADETQRGYRKPDDGGNVIFFLQPLVEKDDDKHGCHDKIDPGCVKLQQRADQSADRGADGPVEIVQ